MIASYVLTYTLVPTMARFLLKGHEHRHAATRARPRGGRRKGSPSSCGSSRLSSAASRRPAAGLSRPAQRWRCASPRLRRCGFLAIAVLRVVWARTVPRARLLPDRRLPTRCASTSARRRARASRRRRRSSMSVEAESPRAAAARPRATSVVNNIGLPNSGINITYGNSGTIGVFDNDMLVTLGTRAKRAGLGLCEDAARPSCRKRLSRRVLRVPAGRHGQPDPELRRAGAARRPDCRRQGRRATAPIAAKLLAKIRHVPGHRRSAHPGTGQATPALNVAFNRELAGVVGLTERRRLDKHPDDAVGQHPDERRPIGSIPSNGVSYAGLCPDAAIFDRHDGRARQRAAGRRQRRPSFSVASPTCTPEPLDGRRRPLRREATPSTSSPRTRTAISAASSPTSRRSSTTRARSCRKARRWIIRGQAVTMSTAYQQLFDRSGLLDRPDLPADRREFSIMAGSLRDHHGPASGSRRHHLDAVRHP